MLMRIRRMLCVRAYTVCSQSAVKTVVNAKLLMQWLSGRAVEAPAPDELPHGGLSGIGPMLSLEVRQELTRNSVIVGALLLSQRVIVDFVLRCLDTARFCR
jgi:hypothetical protein